MDVHVLGVSHRTLGVEGRERAALRPPAALMLMEALAGRGDVSEAVALSTCNRTEVYVAAPAGADVERPVADALAAHTRIDREQLAAASYVHHGDAAVTQLFRVTAGLDAMVVGESEIQGQVRGAWRCAADAGTSGPALDALFHEALRVGRRARATTRIGVGAASVSSAAVDLAATSLGRLAGRRVLVVGAGRVAGSAVRALAARGARGVVVANRTPATARALAARAGGRGVGLDEVATELEAADLVLAATDAPSVVVGARDVERAMARRPGRRMLVVDVSVPRDVDPAVRGVPGVELVDIDDLVARVEAALDGRRAAAVEAEDLVRAAVAGFAGSRRGRRATPAIVSLRARAEQIRRAALEDACWDGLSPADRRRVEALTRAIVNKLLHEPTVRARAAAEGDDALGHLESLRHLFGLEVPAGT